MNSRWDVEARAKWRERSALIPYLQFPQHWEVAVIPPYAGADARFLVRCGNAKVSVYLDFDGNLGAMDEPYWEIYPLDGDACRYLLNETNALLEGIAMSIQEQATPPPPAEGSR
jgi:hypothetical protein